jgi:glucose-6-phosphate isomerase
VTALTHSPAWQAVARHREATAGTTLHELFAADPQRAERFTRTAAGITLDAGKTHLTPASFEALVDLARQEDVFGWQQRMFAGEAINNTEGRPALHAALRTPELAQIQVNGEAFATPLARTETRLRALVEGVHAGTVTGADGGPITDVVHIGIGGSDLGPRLACEALARQARAQPRVHFIANLDPDERDAVLARIDPARTLVIMASKTFGTLETLANGRALRAHLAERFGDAGALAQFVAVTGRDDRAQAWGIAAERVLPLWDGVGGRYSLWSPIGLPVALALGLAAFDDLRAGGAAMDRHFRDAPAADNLPLWLALIGIWYTNFVGVASHVVVPYAQRLVSLPHYLQQLEMESNGKSVDRDGTPVDYATAPALWGQVGTPGQHAFFQWLHQGTQRVSCDLIAVREAESGAGGDRDALAANAFGQGAALLEGRSRETLRRADVPEWLRPHRAMPGDRPTTTLLLDGLTPHTLGALIALYEHKVFCQAMVWRLNPFDQWGVERGKEWAGALTPVLTGEATPQAWDPSTRSLAERYRRS